MDVTRRNFVAAAAVAGVAANAGIALAGEPRPSSSATSRLWARAARASRPPSKPPKRA